jgi:AraC-like DNA-binding protein
MLYNSSKPVPIGTGDPLTEMMRGLRLDGVEYGRCVMAEPWGVHFPAQSAARFHFIGAGAAFLRTPAQEWIALKPGDAVLVPRGAEHVLASAPGAPTGPIERYEVKPVCGNIFDVCCDGGGPKALLFCGSMRFNFDGQHPLLALMPDVMRACDLSGEPTVQHLLEAMARECAADRVGSGGMLARLADVLAAIIVRSWVEGGCGDATGWIAAVRNPQIGRVLAAIHLDPSRDWRVSTLAKIVGASRSGFAQRFAEIVGETPARYVARVRMHQARQWFVRDGMRVSVVARRLGYDSEASFSRAFRRVLGHTPSHFRARPGNDPAQAERLLASASGGD